MTIANETDWSKMSF